MHRFANWAGLLRDLRIGRQNPAGQEDLARRETAQVLMVFR